MAKRHWRFHLRGWLALYTYRYQDIWLHTMASYTHLLENNDDYKFGDQTQFGLALHYTPNYDWMFGVESDTVYFDKNEYNSDIVGNTGGTRSMLTGVTSWRFFTALGGNFSLRLTAGVPVYQNLNDTTMPNGMQAVQMGAGVVRQSVDNVQPSICHQLIRYILESRPSQTSIERLINRRCLPPGHYH